MGGEQVLVCPDCQVDGWTDGLDQCAACGGTVLVKRLGEVACRQCGHVGPALPGADAGRSRRPATDPRTALAADVAAALARVLGAD